MAREVSQEAYSGFVGAGSRLTGRLTAPGPFSVNGDFSGEIHSQGVVSVGTDGSFDGSIFAERVVVEDGGRVSGKIDAHEVEIRSGGVIVGVTVQAASLRLEIESNTDGARFHIHPDYQRSRPEASNPPAPNPAGVVESGVEPVGEPSNPAQNQTLRGGE